MSKVWVLDYFGGVKTVTPEEYFNAKLHAKHHWRSELLVHVVLILLFVVQQYVFMTAPESPTYEKVTQHFNIQANIWLENE